MSDDIGLLRVAALSVEEAWGQPADELVQDPRVATAIALAAGRELLALGEDHPRARSAVRRYASRMGGRATPYGLLAGTAMAKVGAGQRLVLDTRDHDRARVRVDIEALQLVVKEALDATDPGHWPLRVNPTIRRLGGELRYAKPGDASADVVSVRATTAIEAVVGICGPGTVRGADVIDRLSARSPGTPRDALAGYLGRLVDAGLLLRAVDLIEPGCEPGELAWEALTRAGATGCATAMRTLLDEACGLRLIGAGLAELLERSWAKAAEALPALADVPTRDRYHIDLEHRTLEATIGREVVRELEMTLRRLHGMFPAPDPLKSAREAFRQRYEDAEVPLLEATDQETGILVGAEREMSKAAELAGVQYPGAEQKLQLYAPALRALSHWLKTGEPFDIGSYPVAERNAQQSVHAALIGARPGDGFHSMLLAGHRRTPTALLARFALSRPDFDQGLQDWLDGQQHRSDGGEDDSGRPIHAELVHAPDGRVGNVLLRPKLLDEAIVFPGGSGGTLTLDRLLLRLVGSEFRLRDSVTGRRVLFELNSAHNVAAVGSHPLYTFLGHVADMRPIGWTWGDLGGLPHLPRVTCGRVLVAKEMWHLTGEDIVRILASDHPADVLRSELEGLGRRRWIGVGQYDQVLPMDVYCDVSVSDALDRMRMRKHVEFSEMPQLEAPAVEGPKGGHAAEIIVPLSMTDPVDRHGEAAVAYASGPGRAWVYFKYYTGAAAADRTIGRLHALARRLEAEGRADAWFFLRYNDEGHHVRVRVRPTGPEHRVHVIAVMDELGRTLNDEGLVSRTVMDGYVPEAGRYGGAENLPLAEEVFSNDSHDVAEFLRRSPDEYTRLHRAVADVIQWCDVLFDTEEARHTFLKTCQSGLEFSFLKVGNLQGKFHREHRTALDREVADSTLTSATEAALKALVESLRGRAGPRTTTRVLAALLHMHCNRIYASDPRRLEFLTYELATRKMRERRARLEA
ncbi:thiopeptide-type bacteriocin biosynthesis protein [Streptomyces sp. NPDC004726]